MKPAGAELGTRVPGSFSLSLPVGPFVLGEGRGACLVGEFGEKSYLAGPRGYLLSSEDAGSADTHIPPLGTTGGGGEARMPFGSGLQLGVRGGQCLAVAPGLPAISPPDHGAHESGALTPRRRQRTKTQGRVIWSWERAPGPGPAAGAGRGAAWGLNSGEGRAGACHPSCPPTWQAPAGFGGLEGTLRGFQAGEQILQKRLITQQDPAPVWVPRGEAPRPRSESGSGAGAPQHGSRAREHPARQLRSSGPSARGADGRQGRGPAGLQPQGRVCHSLRFLEHPWGGN